MKAGQAQSDRGQRAGKQPVPTAKLRARVDEVALQLQTSRQQIEALPPSPEKTGLLARVAQQERELNAIVKHMDAQDQATANQFSGEVDAIITGGKSIVAGLVTTHKAVKSKGGSVVQSILKGEL